MKGKKTTIALAFLIVILVSVIGFRYSEISGKSPIQPSQKSSQVKNVTKSEEKSNKKSDNEKERHNHNLLGRLYESYNSNSPSKSYKL